jgi:hypothetical protein
MIISLYLSCYRYIVYTKTHEAWMHFELVESKVAQTENTELVKTRQNISIFNMAVPKRPKGHVDWNPVITVMSLAKAKAYR